LDIWTDVTRKGYELMRKTITFLTALAVKQNAPDIAIEIISTIRRSRYIDVRCLKVMAYTDLKKFTEIVPILRMSLEDDTRDVKEVYFYDVVCIQFILFNSCKFT